MKTLDEFREYFNASMQADLQSLEELRKTTSKKLLILAICLCIVLFGSFIIINYYYTNIDMHLLFVWPIIFGIFYVKISKNYVKEFKLRVIRKIVKFIDEKLEYEVNNYISEEDFISSQIFKKKPDRYKGDDFVAGKIGKTNIEFSEIHAEYKTSDGKNTQWHTIFKGLFFIIDFNKNFSGRTVVLPDTAEKLFGFIGKVFQHLNIMRDQLIKLEDPEFEKEFSVYGTDQIESRYILSTSLMKRILEFKKKTGHSIYISFIQSKMFIGISYTKDLFEPRIFRTLMDFNPYQEYFNLMHLAIGIVEDLNLNTRIWTKT